MYVPETKSLTALQPEHKVLTAGSTEHDDHSPSPAQPSHSPLAPEDGRLLVNRQARFKFLDLVVDQRAIHDALLAQLVHDGARAEVGRRGALMFDFHCHDDIRRCNATADLPSRFFFATEATLSDKMPGIDWAEAFSAHASQVGLVVVKVLGSVNGVSWSPLPAVPRLDKLQRDKTFRKITGLALATRNAPSGSLLCAPPGPDVAVDLASVPVAQPVWVLVDPAHVPAAVRFLTADAVGPKQLAIRPLLTNLIAAVLLPCSELPQTSSAAPGLYVVTIPLLAFRRRCWHAECRRIEYDVKTTREGAIRTDTDVKDLDRRLEPFQQCLLSYCQLCKHLPHGAVYCSPACQKADWRTTHKREHEINVYRRVVDVAAVEITWKASSPDSAADFTGSE